MKTNLTLRDDLEKIQKESGIQERPDQKTVVSVSSHLRKRLHNLPDPKNPPLGYDEHKQFDRVFPWINIPALHPRTQADTVIFNDQSAPANKLYLGDNLQILRTLKSDSIDLIYIDPPFFSGRNYNVIWGDTNEVRTFEDIWEGGITSYLIWLNARLWEMRRVLKKTGSIYVHCDWHASHYIKVEMDKIFGYENFLDEIIWYYGGPSRGKEKYPMKHDIIFWYSKSSKYKFLPQFSQIKEYLVKRARKDPDGRLWVDQNLGKLSTDKYNELRLKGYVFKTLTGKERRKQYLDEMEGDLIDSVWQIPIINSQSNERIGYPTQKPEALIERIIKASSNEGDIVADFFVGGGTTCATAMKLKRKFVGCDSSRVAISVTSDRLVKIGEEMSGVKSNITVENKPLQLGLQMEGAIEKVPNINVYYLGVYPVEKFKNLEQEEFINFVLTAYGASRNTGEGVTHGYKPPAQQEPIYIGPADPNESIEPEEIKNFFDEIKSKVEPNKMVRTKIIAWRFSRRVIEYIKILQKYAEKNNLPIELEAIPLDSKEFRERILQRMPDVEEAELFLRFSKPPVIGDIKIKKVNPLEYELEAIDAISTNEDGWLVNCQWDFDYQEGHFAADKDYVLSREKRNDDKRGDIFEAILKSRHTFEKEEKYVIACKVQDNLAGETIISKRIEIK